MQQWLQITKAQQIKEITTPTNLRLLLQQQLKAHPAWSLQPSLQVLSLARLPALVATDSVPETIAVLGILLALGSGVDAVSEIALAEVVAL